MTCFILGFIAFPITLFALAIQDYKRIQRMKDANGAVSKKGAHL